MTKATKIRMAYTKLFALTVILQSAVLQSAPIDFIKFEQELREIEHEMDKMKQRMDDQKSEHETQIHELRQIIATILQEDRAIKGQKKLSDIMPANATFKALEERVNHLEVAMQEVREDVFDVETDVVRVNALEANDYAQDQQISQLETTVYDYLDVGIGFHVTLNLSEQFLALGDAVKFDTIIINYGGAFNLTSSSFVAPRRGLYRFSLYFLTSSPAVDTDLCIMVNGTCACSAAANNGSAYETGTCFALVELQPGNIVHVKLWIDTGSDGGVVYNGGYTGFTGWLYKAL